MLTYARVCEEKLEKSDAHWNNFAVKGVSLKDHIRVGRHTYQDDILKDNSP